MAFVFLDDKEKLDCVSDVLAGLTSKSSMRICDTGCMSEGTRHIYFHRDGIECPKCGNPDTKPAPMTAEIWAGIFEMDMAKVAGFEQPEAIFRTPFDAWVSTVTDTITVSLKTGYETYPLPPRDTWVFDLTQLYSGRKRPKSFRIRRGAVTAA